MSEGGGATLRLGRRAPIALVLALLVALVGGTAAGAAPAAPNAALAARARALQAKLDAQHAEVERLAERLNATDDRRHRLQQRLAHLRARQRAAQRELETAQRRLDEQVRATYMEGPQWLLGELIGGTSPPDVLRRIPMQKAALEARAAVVTSWTALSVAVTKRCPLLQTRFRWWSAGRAAAWRCTGRRRRERGTTPVHGRGPGPDTRSMR